VPVAIIGVLALTAPLRAAEQPLLRVGFLLAIAGGLELLHAVRVPEASAMRRAITSGSLTVLMALVVINAPFLVGTAIVLFLAGSFAIDGVRPPGAAGREAGRSRAMGALAALGNIGASALLLATHRVSETWLVSIGAALRAFGIAWTIATAPAYTADDAGRTVLDDLGIADHPAVTALYAEIAAEEHTRTSSDRGWIGAFIGTLFAIHIARMQADGSPLGLLAPAIAVTGDMLLAILVALIIIVPVVISVRSSTRWLERRAWQWYLSADGSGHGWRRLTVAGWLRYRLRVGMRLREARFSTMAAIRRSLATGLPIAAIIAATVPVWGMSWFFDTENWASGIWNSWAESRTDEWRKAMADAVIARAGAGPSTFLVSPPGTASDFSFIVIGDTGEGDASQHSLRDQLLAVAERPDVRFVVIS